MNLLRENAGLKIFSLVMGLVIFLAVRNEQEVTSTLPVQITLREQADMINTADLPGEVLVRVAGSPGAISSLAAEPSRTIELDLAGLSRGVSTVRVREEQLALPSNVQVISISPSVLTVRLEARERRVVPIKATVRGEPGRGYALGDPQVEPATAEADGPRRELRDNPLVRTAVIDVEGATEPVKAEVTLDPPGQHSRVVAPAKVTVTIPVKPVPMDRVLQLAVELPGDPSPMPVKATVRGPQPLVEAIEEAKLRTRPIPDPRKPRAPIPVAVEGLPEGVSVIGVPTVTRGKRPRG